MIAAVYARKSNDQQVAEEAKSTARQIAHARDYAAKRGWTVVDEYVYRDDGISGAEFRNRRGFVRLLNALKPKAPFQVLIVSELSRIGREQLETGYALKQISQAGVQIFSYLEDKELALDTPTDKFLMAAVSFAAELERDKASQRAHDKARQQAAHAYVTGGRTFGYTNHVVMSPDGRRSHVERRIDDAEAAVVRQIFRWCAEGVGGPTRIAKRLNADGVLALRSRTWSPMAVRLVLLRTLYRGVLTWNRMRKRNTWGAVHPTARPMRDWIEVPAPQLRIVSDAEWDAAQRRLAAIHTGAQDGHRRRRDRDSHYLLPGFGRCGVCQGGVHVRQRGKRRAFTYACTTHYKRGHAVCPHVEQWPMEAIDRGVLASIAGEALSPDLIADILAAARTMYDREQHQDASDARRRELETTTRELARLTEAVATAGDVPMLVERIRATEAKRRDLVAALDARPDRPAWREIERRVRRSLDDWRALLQGDIVRAREGFRQLLTTPIVLTPVVERGRRGVRWEGRIGVHAILGNLWENAWGIQRPTGMGSGVNYQRKFQGIWRSDRAA